MSRAQTVGNNLIVVYSWRQIGSHTLEIDVHPVQGIRPFCDPACVSRIITVSHGICVKLQVDSSTCYTGLLSLI